MELHLPRSIQDGFEKIREAADRDVYVDRETYLQFLMTVIGKKDELCVVCQENFETRPIDVVETADLSCQHQFHRPYLTEWMRGNHEQRDSCPACRQQLCTFTPLTPEEHAQRVANANARSALLAQELGAAQDSNVTELSEAEVLHRLQLRTNQLSLDHTTDLRSITDIAQVLAVFMLESRGKVLNEDHNQWGVLWALRTMLLCLMDRLRLSPQHDVYSRYGRLVEDLTRLALLHGNSLKDRLEDPPLGALGHSGYDDQDAPGTEDALEGLSFSDVCHAPKGRFELLLHELLRALSNSVLDRVLSTDQSLDKVLAQQILEPFAQNFPLTYFTPDHERYGMHWLICHATKTFFDRLEQSEQESPDWLDAFFYNSLMQMTAMRNHKWGFRVDPCSLTILYGKWTAYACRKYCVPTKEADIRAEELKLRHDIPKNGRAFLLSVTFPDGVTRQIMSPAPWHDIMQSAQESPTESMATPSVSARDDEEHGDQ